MPDPTDTIDQTDDTPDSVPPPDPQPDEVPEATVTEVVIQGSNEPGVLPPSLR